MDFRRISMDFLSQISFFLPPMGTHEREMGTRTFQQQQKTSIDVPSGYGPNDTDNIKYLVFEAPLAL